MANVQKRSESAKTPVAAGETAGSLMGLRREMDRLFDDFLSDFPWLPARRRFFDFRPSEGFGQLLPSLDLSETDKAYEISVELPGMDEKDIELTIADGMLTIKGEKKEEREEKKKEYYFSERRFGTLHRAIAIPDGVDEGKISAKFDKGVLEIRLPKTAQKKKGAKRIPIR